MLNKAVDQVATPRISSSSLCASCCSWGPNPKRIPVLGEIAMHQKHPKMQPKQMTLSSEDQRKTAF